VLTVSDSPAGNKFERFKAMFLDECFEHCQTLERSLTAMQRGARSQSLVDDAFRAIHSVKGGAGMFGFDRIVPFSHVFETALDGIRLGELEISEELMAAALRATDCLSDLINAAGANVDLVKGYEENPLHTLMRAARLEPENVSQQTPVPDLKSESLATPGEMQKFQIKFRPYIGVLRRANEPLLIVRNLSRLGKVDVTVDLSVLPILADMQPMDSYLGWTFVLETKCREAEVLGVFQFVDGDCDLELLKIHEEIAVQVPSVSEAAQISVPVEFHHAEPIVTSIRVEVGRIDRLVNLASEIAISQALVAQQIDQTLFNSNPRLFQELSHLLTHIQNLQDSVMAIRAQPISAIYDRMPRLVRELCELTNKRMILRTKGEATEIDKSIIEQLSDPIMHMIRNAADHGIESADERLASGKPADGIITLAAEQRGSRIIIEISDDGRGIDREKVRRIAIAKKLVSPDARLSAEEIENLVFLPGFSTADSVTNISGRGVGMDVVKRNIQKIGGRVSLRSEQGQGSTVVLTLPLTLAVLEGMIVRSGAESYVIPISNIVECRASWSKDAGQIPGSGDVLKVRGGYVSLVYLDRIFKSGTATNRDQSVAIITEVEGGQQVALVVDEILGQQQVVIKTITDNLDPIAGVAGATILGDGRVALIIDASEIAALGAVDDNNLHSTEPTRRDAA
jgi:two-component system, chemotaxis family, sensor kinase CheA